MHMHSFSISPATLDTFYVCICLQTLPFSIRMQLVCAPVLPTYNNLISFDLILIAVISV